MSSVDLTPTELGFRRPFDKEVTEVLKVWLLSLICSLSNEPTAPQWQSPSGRLQGQDDRSQAVGCPTLLKQHHKLTTNRYCVRPNSGIIQPDQSVEVQGMCLRKSNTSLLLTNVQSFSRL
jgi:hypothetical protein